ncbi:MAG: NAD(+)/NADH kinase [Candidatus Promineifilaceae bacterium]|nr:NAD(+)/NADH kinase [Candidatus Promineifilaceae bacterium]
MKFVGILHQSRIPETEPLANEIAVWLENRGIDSWVGSIWDDEDVDGRLSSLDLLVVLGGDGSTLRAARLSTPFDIPIFGVNLGRVGFLSEAQPGEWPEKLTKVLNGDFWLERRLRMLAYLERDGRVMGSYTALNEIVLGRGQQARVIRLHLVVDGDLVTTYVSDALIVATPTGSTAYAMAAGGPLLPPQLQNFVVVPVASHLSLDRPLVLHEEAEISIRVDMDHEANLTADGQQGAALESGDLIKIQKHERPCLFARVEPSGYFYRRLMRRLGFSWPRR